MLSMRLASIHEKTANTCNRDLPNIHLEQQIPLSLCVTVGKRPFQLLTPTPQLQLLIVHLVHAQGPLGRTSRHLCYV